MITADIVVLIVFLSCLIVGSLFGFSRTIRWFTGGIFGIIISIIVSYFLFGIVLDWGFVRFLLDKLVTALAASDSWICKVLLAIRLELIVFGLALFTVVQILRMIIVSALSRVMQTSTPVMRVINSLFGVVFLLAFSLMMMLVVFQVIAWIGGVEGQFYQGLIGSNFGLDSIFRDNPLNSIFENIRISAGV